MQRRNPRIQNSRPLYKLSIELIDTYKRINQNYYLSKYNPKIVENPVARMVEAANSSCDDANYDYIIREDEILADRYQVKNRIGKGSFGQVVIAVDRHANKEVAIKIIKSRRPFMLQAQSEIELLKLTNEKDHDDSCNIVRLLDTFVHKNHQCIVFERLSINLYELLKKRGFRGLSLEVIRKFAKQILRALTFLGRESINIIHCDIKPENVLLREPRRSDIKLIDFGSSCLASNMPYSYIQSRYYRSPEVLLGLPYSHKIDLWSLGCLLVELYTGAPLFPGADQMDQLRKMINVLGMPPVSMIERMLPERRAMFFDKVSRSFASAIGLAFEYQDILPTADGTEIYILKRTSHSPGSAGSASNFIRRTIEQIIGVQEGGPHYFKQSYHDFSNLIRGLLTYDPFYRLSAFQASLHPLVVTEEDEQLQMAMQRNSQPSNAGVEPMDVHNEPQLPSFNPTAATAAPGATGYTRRQRQQGRRQAGDAQPQNNEAAGRPVGMSAKETKPSARGSRSMRDNSVAPSPKKESEPLSPSTSQRSAYHLRSRSAPGT